MPVILDYSLPQTGPIQLVIDEAAQCASINGKPCHLTLQEFMLLKMLLDHRGAVLSREELLQGAWDYSSPGDTRTVDVHIQRLRRKLGFPCIETVHRAGYRLLDPGRP